MTKEDCKGCPFLGSMEHFDKRGYKDFPYCEYAPKSFIGSRVIRKGFVCPKEKDERQKEQEPWDGVGGQYPYCRYCVRKGTRYCGLCSCNDENLGKPNIYNYYVPKEQ